MRFSRLILVGSVLFNVSLTGFVVYKHRQKWFENSVLKEPFRESIFQNLPPDSSKIYFIGDSHTEAFELAEILNNANVRNRGIWGDLTTGVLNRLDVVIRNKPSKIFIMIGVNDICAGDKSVAEIGENTAEIIKRIRQKSPATKIYLQSVLPTNQAVAGTDRSALASIVALNNYYKTLSRPQGAIYVDLFPYFLEQDALKAEYSFDGLHMNGKGYMKWKQLLSPYI